MKALRLNFSVLNALSVNWISTEMQERLLAKSIGVHLNLMRNIPDLFELIEFSFIIEFRYLALVLDLPGYDL